MVKKLFKNSGNGLDFNYLLEKINSKKDYPLLLEANKAAKGGALRAAYIMIWLSCAESLKRRFKEAKNSDHEAGKIVAEITKKEENQRSVDKYILIKAKEYGFISDSEMEVLEHIYILCVVYMLIRMKKDHQKCKYCMLLVQ